MRPGSRAVAVLTFFLCVKRQRGVSTSNSINIKKSGKKKRDQKCEDSFVFTFPLVHFAPHARLSDIVDRVFDQVKAPSGMLNWICCSRSLSITLEKAVNGFPGWSISSSEGGGHAGWHVLMVMPGFHSKAVLHAPLATEHSASDVPAASGQNGGGKALVRHRRRLHHKRNIGRRVMLPAFTPLQSTPLERSEAPSTLIALSNYSQMTLVSTVIGSPRSTARNFRWLWTGGSTLKFPRPLILKSHKSAKFPLILDAQLAEDLPNDPGKTCAPSYLLLTKTSE
jgi:hypothetical protein